MVCRWQDSSLTADLPMRDLVVTHLKFLFRFFILWSLRVFLFCLPHRLGLLLSHILLDFSDILSVVLTLCSSLIPHWEQNEELGLSPIEQVSGSLLLFWSLKFSLSFKNTKTNAHCSWITTFHSPWFFFSWRFYQSAPEYCPVPSVRAFDVYGSAWKEEFMWLLLLSSSLMFVCPCLSVCTPHAVSTHARQQGHGIPWNWSCRQLRTAPSLGNHILSLGNTD